ncbi:AAA family ATPase [Tautonia sociabilis]|uniref:Adenylate/guanylate cyclase domain-containing protein n=1 Tax=Tautonia sociabilis TaxID=2080755 RepID=A0A432MGM4_9BACT|nr:adenylate/guanylate cyclase domain-containing protein [Tautonia sociabilis]RUL85729.1 adenylate/guanylate cyclase domain-containing protein [Tautonia sociabilis]
MAPPIETLAPYVPALVLRRFAANPRRIRQELERVLGVVLFTDISGFTALTERLADRGPDGAEELSRLLNAYFSRLIALIEAHGGDVLKLAGDALVALFRSSDEEPIRNASLHAVQCGLAIQRTLGAFPAAEGVTLTSKVGIALGQLLALHVGGVFDRWEMMIVGDPLGRMAQAEHRARSGQQDVILAPEVWRQVRRHCLATPLDEGFVRLDRVENPLPLWPLTRPCPAPEAAPGLLGYVPGAIRSRLEAGQTGWLSELRRITVLFVNLPGLNRTAPGDLDRIQCVMRTLQEAIYRFEGSVNKLSVDDKGITLVAALGLPPLAHEDDPARGSRAALELVDRLRKLGVDCAVGVTTGLAYCGEIGGSSRREYTIIGDVVNLSARLMQAALQSGEPGAIRCDAETIRAAADRVEFQLLGPITVKGKADPVAVGRPVRAIEPRPEGSGSTSLFVEPFRPLGEALGRALRPFVGRVAELNQLERLLDAVGDGRGRPVILEGEPGIGKSRLIAEFSRRARQRGLVVRGGAAEAVERSTAYFAWRPIVARLLGVGPDDDSRSRLDHVRTRLAASPGRLDLLPLLNPILALDEPDTEITAPLSGPVRAENTRDLIVTLLREAIDRDGPTVIVLEDGHWLDSASWALTASIVRARIGGLLLLLSTRPVREARPEELDALMTDPARVLLRLEPLDRDDAIALARSRLGVDEIPAPLRTLIRRKAQGNSLFIEELIQSLRDSGKILIEGGCCRLPPDFDPQDVSVPDTLRGLITDRIDRLPPAQQMTLKVASVIGRQFPYRLLSDIFPFEQERPALPRHLDALEHQDLTYRGPAEPDLSYLFKHVVTQEVAYDLLLFAHRRRLHRRVALWLERSSTGELSPYYPLLAHHWGRAQVIDRALSYLERAGEQALRGGSATEAARFLEEALRLAATDPAGVDSGRLAHWEGLLGRAYLDLGRTAESKRHILNALRRLGRPMPEGPAPLALAYGRQLALQASRRLFPNWLIGKGQGDPAELRRLAVSYDVLGQISYYAQDTAGGVFAALRALNLAEGAGPSPELARSYATMCIAASLVPAHRLAEVYSRRARDAADTIGDPATDAWVSELTGIYWLGVGRWEPSRQALTRAVAVNDRLGDWRRWEESVGELARLEYFRGNYHSGASGFDAMGVIARERGHPQAEIWWRNGLAKNLFRLGQVDRAAALLESSPTLRSPGVDRADAILGLGFLALVRWHLGREAEALAAAEETLALILRARPIVNYNLEGYAGTAEVLLSCWERHVASGSPAPADLRRRALLACSALERFAGVFPIARPRARLCRGLARWLSGRHRAARRNWRAAVAEAERLSMPFEHARALTELARHALPRDPSRSLALAEALELFEAIGASAEVDRVVRLRAE